MTSAIVVDLATLRRRRQRRLRRDTDRDRYLNAEWDRLTAAVDQAWCMRDLESLDLLLRIAATLRAEVHRDWSG